MMTQSPLFAKPPCVERVLGVQFHPIRGLTNGHLGAFWNLLGDPWTEVSDAPPLPQELEKFGDERQWTRIGTMRFGISDTPISRLQIRNASHDRMIQIQNGRLHYNWLGGDYVRFEPLLEEFKRTHARFTQFLNSCKLGTVECNQWEVTYVNHLPIGTVWNSSGDWHEAFLPTVTPPLNLQNSTAEGFTSKWQYEIQPRKGRLHVELQHGKNASDVEVIILKLTARGPADSHEVMDGLHLGHNTIVESFVQLASEKSRRFWEQEK